MEGGPNAIQSKTDPRSAALVPLRSQRHQQRFYISPVDVGPNRVGKNGAKRFLVFANHGLMISDNSIKSSLIGSFVCSPGNVVSMLRQFEFYRSECIAAVAGLECGASGDALHI